jgi:TetR/AcrR family transcriptional repressor of nem operon
MDTRSRILAAAQRLFHEQGYHATGISTILREADVNAGSLYNFFPGKEALLVGVLEQYRELLHPIVMAPVEAATKDPIERVFALLAQYRTWLSPLAFRMGCPIGNLALEAGDNSPQVRTLVSANFEGWIGCVRKWLEDAGDRLPADCDRDQLARFVLTVMEGAVMQARAAASVEHYDASVAQLRAHFDLLLARGSKPGTKRTQSKRARSSAKPTRRRRP